MKNSQQILSSVLKTTQMGQIGIRSVLDTRMRPGLRRALEQQLREYDQIETEAHTLAAQRGWELKDLDPAVRMMSNMVTRMKLSAGGTESKIADVILFVVDVESGINDLDTEVADILRRCKRPVIVVANKADNYAMHAASAEFYSFGLGDPVCDAGLVLCL